MKKILCMLLACVLCVSALGGCQVEYPEWVIEDFYGYDADGNLHKDYLKVREERWEAFSYIGDATDQELLYTYRGLKPGDSVDTLIRKYPVDDFHFYLGSNMDEKKQEAYEKDLKKAMREETESASDLYIWLEYYVYVDKDGEIHPSSSTSSWERRNEVLNNTDIEMAYYLSIRVGERQVLNISFGQETRDAIL